MPTGPRGGEPTGKPFKPNYNDPDTTNIISDLSAGRAADDLAALGYKVERNPKAPELRTNPDLKIEGEYFDVKTPQGSSVRSFAKNNIEKKIDQAGGRFVVPISPGLSKFTAEDLIKQLTDFPIQGLKEVIILHPNGTVTVFVP